MDAAAFGYELDDSRWPLLMVRVPPIQTAEGVKAYLDEVEGFEGRGPFVVVVDTSASTRMDTEARRALSQRGLKITQRGVPCVGAALIVTNRFQRGVAQALAWFAEKLEVSIQPNQAQAEAWARQRLLAVGASLPRVRTPARSTPSVST